MRALAGLALSLAVATAVGADDAARREQGKNLYQAYCSRCHGEDGAETTGYPGVKSLRGVTSRYTEAQVIEKSRGFAAAAIEGESAGALYAFLSTFQQAPAYAAPALLVEGDWLAKHLQDPGVRVVDMRPGYPAGHIPGAVRLEDGPLRSADDRETYLPKPAALAEFLGKAGIGNRTHVVIYDDQGGRVAARLWYVLNAYGHQRVSILNGGWLRWVADKRPTTEVVPANRWPAGSTPTA